MMNDYSTDGIDRDSLYVDRYCSCSKLEGIISIKIGSYKYFSNPNLSTDTLGKKHEACTRRPTKGI